MRKQQLVLSTLIFLMLTGCASWFGNRTARRELVIERSWVRSTLVDDQFAARRTHRMTPLMYEDMLIEGNAVDSIVAYRRDSGSERWRLKIENGVEGGAQLAEGRLYFGGGDGQFYAVSPDSGRVQWTFPVHSETLAAPTVDRGVVYFQSGADLVYALDAATGKQNWLYNRQTTTTLSVRASTRPVTDGDLVYVGFSDGFLVALSRGSGALKWEKKLSRNMRFKDVDATPVIDGNTMYVSSYDGSLYALNKATGDVVWEFEEGGYTPVTIAKDTLFYSTTTGYVHALDKTSGRKIWSVKLKSGIATQPALMGSYLIYGESEGSLVAADARTGSELTRFAPGAGLLSMPLVTPENEIYFISTNGNLFAMKLSLKRQGDRLPWQVGGL